MGSKEPEPWSPKWVREKLREYNNGLPPNDSNHDSKPPAGVVTPCVSNPYDFVNHIFKRL
jgi:hypothetical protein